MVRWKSWKEESNYYFIDIDYMNEKNMIHGNFKQAGEIGSGGELISIQTKLLASSSYLDFSGKFGTTFSCL